MAKMRPHERNLWGAVNNLYEVFRVSGDMETARDATVAKLRLMADEIEDRSRFPNGEEGRVSLIDG
jgi:hypothetical protein